MPSPVIRRLDADRSLAPTTSSLADIVDLMVARYGGLLPAAVITRVVRQCHREHEITHAGTAPLGAVESLADQRLTDMTTGAAAVASSTIDRNTRV